MMDTIICPLSSGDKGGATAGRKPCVKDLTGIGDESLKEGEGDLSMVQGFCRW